jgi:molybdenum cofactor biosynthesis protein B
MSKIDESKPFKAVNIAVLTVSDTRTLETDRSGDTLVERIARDGHVLVDRAIVTDDIDRIRAQVRKWIDDPEVEVVISTGGTGVTGRDVTPEALEGLFEKKIEGFGETFRWISFQKIGTSTMQSRATAGVANATYIFALQGRLGRHPAPAARHPLPPLQLRRADAAAERRQDAPERMRDRG